MAYTIPINIAGSNYTVDAGYKYAIEGLLQLVTQTDLAVCRDTWNLNLNQGFAEGFLVCLLNKINKDDLVALSGSLATAKTAILDAITAIDTDYSEEITEQLGVIKTEVTTSVASVVGNVKADLEVLVGETYDDIWQIAQDVQDNIDAEIKAIDVLIGDEIVTLTGVAEDSLLNVTRLIGVLSGMIDTQLNTSLDFMNRVYSTAIEGFFDVSTGIIGDINALIRNQSGEITSLIQTGISSITGLYDQSVTSINDIAAYFINGANIEADTVVKEITRIPETEINSVSETVRETERIVEETARGQVEESIEEIDETASSSKSVAQVLGEIKDELFSGRSPGALQISDPDNILGVAAKTEEDTDKLKKTAAAWDRIIKLMSIEGLTADQLSDEINALADDMTWWESLMLYGMKLLSAFMFMMQLINISNTARTTKAQQEVLKNNPVNTFSLSEAVSLYIKGVISESDAKTEAAKNGYSNIRFDNATEGSYTPIDPERAINLYNRGAIDEKVFEGYLKRSGYNIADIKAMYNLADLRPGVQDIISMAVRDVFSPAIATDFGLFDELPERFVEEANKSGLKGDWPKFYWGAHWRLPSANQGFEMFQREIIGEERLQLLLKALDYSPKWREDLIKLSYQPITRVDIRRMHDIGELTPDEVTKRYRAIGYSPEDALKLTKFTEKLNAKGGDIDPDDVRKATVSQIKQLYLLGTLDPEETIERMKELNYPQDLAILIRDGWKTDENIALRRARIKKYVRVAIDRDLDYNGVTELFAPLDLTSEERERVDEDIELNAETYNATPTKKELDDMLSMKLIGYNAWQAAYHAKGYDYVWIEAYARKEGFYDLLGPINYG